MKLLHVDSSPLGANSVSRELSAAIVGRAKALHADLSVDVLDLVADAIPQLDMDALGFRLGIEDANLTDAPRRENRRTQGLIDRLFAADAIVIGAPMYNFTIPTQLKAWIDRLAQARITFKYTENGPVGLVTGKKVYIASARGGFYSTSDAGRAMDFQEDYLKVVLGFMGMTDVTIVRAEGVGMGPEARAKAVAAAKEQIAALAI